MFRVKIARNLLILKKMKKFGLYLILFLLVFTSCKGKESKQTQVEVKIQLSDSIDQAIFNSIKEIVNDKVLYSKEISVRTVEIAKLFLQTPYVAGTLETKGKEELVVNLRELDCTTFLENVIVFSEISGKPDFDILDFLKELEFIRYKNGKITDYTSRLHYFTDWIFYNQKKGILKDINQEIGGVNYQKHINFMSTHINSYEALKADTSLVKIIRQTEDSINKRELFYIPEENIAAVENKIENGDLIAITIKIKGLEISHVGIAIYVNNRLHLMHASSKAKKVVISDVPLAKMIMNNKLQSGIMVARLK